MVDANELGRADQLEALMDGLILKIMLNLNQRGYETPEILDAFENICARRREAYEQDPDPASDPDAAEDPQ